MAMTTVDEASYETVARGAARLRRAMGPVGLWTFALDAQPASLVRETAAELDELGWGALWFGEAFGRDTVSQAWLLFSATRRLTVASGIANVMVAPPMPFLPAEAHGQLVVLALLAYAGDAGAGERALAPFRALADPIRCRLLLALREGPAYPADLAEELGSSRSKLSNHLACLRGCGLVVAAPEGRRVRYELADSHLAAGLSQLLGLVLAVDPDYVCVDGSPAAAEP